MRDGAQAGDSADLTTLCGLAASVHALRKWLYFYAALR